MARVIQTIAVASALAAAGCGATARDTSGPVYTPPSTNQTTQTAPTGPTEVSSSARGVVPAGQELDVRLQTTLSSETATAEQRFETTTAVDITQDGRVLIPAGSTVRG